MLIHLSLARIAKVLIPSVNFLLSFHKVKEGPLNPKEVDAEDVVGAGLALPAGTN
jgi:hypothetical protein